MIWDQLMARVVVPMLEDDVELVEVLGGRHIYASQASRPVRVPSVEWLIVGDVYTEVFNPVEIQFDYWAQSMDVATTIERRLRTLLHHNTRRRFGDIDTSMLYDDSFTQEYPKPGIIFRSLRFRFEPVRHRYAPGVAS